MGDLNGIPAGDIIGARVVGMITNITLGNFKCFRYVSINPKLVTVLIGPNGTGKSGVLQALMLLKQSKDDVRSLALRGGLVWLAREEFALRGSDKHPEGVELSLSGSWHTKSEIIEDRVDFDVDLRYSNRASFIERWGSTKFRYWGEEWEIPFESHRGSNMYIATPLGNIQYEQQAGINSFRVASYSGVTQINLELWQLLSGVPTNAMANIKIVPAARALTRGTYHLGPELSGDISIGEGLGKQEEETATTLAYSRSDVEEVSRLMKRITGVGFRTELIPSQSIKPLSESPVGDIGFVAEGFGTNALVRLLFEVVRTVPGATVLIEEPEVHLHPKAQADLASVLVEEAKADSKQIMMTTHSEHVAGRLLTLMAEGKLSPEEVAIYSFEKDEDGVCSAQEIEVTEHGQVVGGL